MKHSVFNHDALIRFRAKRGLSLQALADMAETSKGYLSELETKQRSEPSLSMAVRIAKALRCNITQLIKHD